MEEREKRVDGGVERHVPENHEDEKYDHEDQRSNGSLDSEETNKTQYAEIASCGRLLQRPSIDQSFGVNFSVEDE